MDPADADELSAVRTREQEFLAPWEPIRPDDFATVEGQAQVIAKFLEQYESGTSLPLVILDDEGAIVGTIALSGIVRGPFLSAHLGYWVASTANGRGYATSAVAATIERGFSELGLHRVQAATLPHNAGSQRVLAKNGFERIGYAPRYLKIAGRWQDHVLFQRIAEDQLD